MESGDFDTEYYALKEIDVPNHVEIFLVIRSSPKLFVILSTDSYILFRQIDEYAYPRSGNFKSAYIQGTMTVLVVHNC